MDNHNPDKLCVVQHKIKGKYVYGIYRLQPDNIFRRIGRLWYDATHAALELQYYQNKRTYYELNQIINKNPNAYTWEE